MNIIENNCCIMSRCVYSDHRIYNTLVDLKVKIENVWESLTIEYIQKLYRSIPRRLLAVIDAKKEDGNY